jgi:hypothetical protein
VYSVRSVSNLADMISSCPAAWLSIAARTAQRSHHPPRPPAAARRADLRVRDLHHRQLGLELRHPRRQRVARGLRLCPGPNTNREGPSSARRTRTKTRRTGRTRVRRGENERGGLRAVAPVPPGRARHRRAAPGCSRSYRSRPPAPPRPAPRRASGSGATLGSLRSDANTREADPGQRESEAAAVAARNREAIPRRLK